MLSGDLEASSEALNIACSIKSWNQVYWYAQRLFGELLLFVVFVSVRCSMKCLGSLWLKILKANWELDNSARTMCYIVLLCGLP